MQLPYQGKALADGGGYAIIEDGKKILIVQYGGQGILLGIYLLSLAFIFALFYGFFLMSSHLQWATVLLVLALVLGAGIWQLYLRQRRRTWKGFRKDHIIAIIDLDKKELQNRDGEWIAPLSHVSFEQRMQWTSSSPALVASFSGKHLTLVKGNPFSGGIAPFSYALRWLGLM